MKHSVFTNRPTSVLSLALLLTVLPDCAPPSPAQSVRDDYKSKGGFQDFADDPELGALRARFDQDRTKILAGPKEFFVLAKASPCSLDQAKLLELNGTTAGEKSLEAADSPGHLGAKNVGHSVAGGSCEGGALRGEVDVRIQWIGTIGLPDQQGYAETPKLMRIQGTVGESGFEGPLVLYTYSGKMTTTVTAGKEQMKIEDIGFDGTYMVEYYDVKTFTPRVLNKRGLTFAFDSSDSLHISSLVEPMPDGRIKSKSWSGAQPTAENIVNQDLLLHGWQTTFAQKIGEIDVPESKMCAQQGRIVKTNDCP